jgi:hypothetical protein
LRQPQLLHSQTTTNNQKLLAQTNRKQFPHQ